MFIKWVTFRERADKNDVFQAGKIGEEELLGISRAYMTNGELTSGGFLISRRKSFIAFGGKMVFPKEFQVLSVDPAIIHDLIWVQARNGDVPVGAVEVGKPLTANREYVGRALKDGNVIPGRVVPMRRGCLIGFGGNAHNVNEYEVLVYKSVAVEGDLFFPPHIV